MAAQEEEKAAGRRAGPHPLLRGRRRDGKYTHGLHPAQMEALRAMCGAFIPSLPAEESDAGGRADPPGGKDLERFYLASAADSNIPDEVAELMVTRCIREAALLAWVVLWVLSTRVGTLLLCGRLSLCGAAGELRRFADMPAERQEAALQRWNRTRWLFPLRIVFALVKILSHYVFYTMVDENSENPHWKAIGYSVEEWQRDPAEAPAPSRPLDNGVVETRALNDTTLLRSLADRGLPVKPGAQHTVECDAVIVGSGCGGGVAAAILASAGYKVVVVEKGDYFAADDYSSVEGPSMERLFEKGGIFCTSNVTTMVFTGSTVGGGSAVNWSACIRTPGEVLQEWSHDHGLPLFATKAGKDGRSKKCVGLLATCMSNGITKKLRIEAKVSISACGALMTPPLLRNSGLKNRHIGRNLHLHPVSMAWGYFPENKQAVPITGKSYEGGIITSMHRVTPRTIIETPALGPGAFAAMVPWESGRDMKERMSRDGLRLRCKGVRDEDLEAFLDEVTIEKGPMHSTADKWAVFSSAHQMGSCRMGSSPKDSAVDGSGESWEAEGLYVCDGSLLPTAVGVNPMITIQSVAYCLSKGIAESMTNAQKHY
uniref:Long-chain-alcohol oxidase n=1 Tax=Aegilops tauschii TaxID=37682 RepID=R7W4J3_AEGTA